MNNQVEGLRCGSDPASGGMNVSATPRVDSTLSYMNIRGEYKLFGVEELANYMLIESRSKRSFRMAELHIDSSIAAHKRVRYN